MFKINKSAILIGFSLILILILTCGCNSREDVKHTSKEDIIKYVNKVIDEPVEYVSKQGEEEDNTIIYTFKLTKRNIEFTLDSYIGAPFIDGTQFGNYKESLHIDYESKIAFDNYYIAEREKIAKKYSIKDVLEGDSDYHYYLTAITNFNDLPNLTNFYLELDKLYNFKEKDPDKVNHIDSGTICGDILGAIEGIKFSNSSSKKLKYNDIYKDLEKRYIGHLKWFNLNDPTVPKKLWNKYDAMP